MQCSICQIAQQDNFRKFHCEGIETVEKCQTNEVPKLLEANRGFLFLYGRINPRLFDGWGGINSQAIIQVFDLYGVPRGERPFLDDKFLAVLSVIREYQSIEAERRKNQQNATAKN